MTRWIHPSSEGQETGACPKTRGVVDRARKKKKKLNKYFSLPIAK
jgi:hypothetical protein